MAARWPSPAASTITPATCLLCKPPPGAASNELVWSVIVAGIADCGVPAMSLTDNGLVYTGRRFAFEAAFETNLRAVGTRMVNSSPYHPQTCGKIERFWQTLKN